jgi:hypothetical protein
VGDIEEWQAGGAYKAVAGWLMLKVELQHSTINNELKLRCGKHRSPALVVDHDVLDIPVG